MKSSKKLLALAVMVVVLAAMSSCKSQQGCPTNFSIEISK